MFCALFTVLPDYLFRRYAQGKRLGVDIDIFSVWYELRWGITACAMLTISLITLVFYYHPTTTNVTSFFRTVTILSEGGGRVQEVYVANNQDVNAGDKLFKLDASTQKAAIETAKRKIEEITATAVVAQSDLASAIGSITQATGALKQAQDELDVKQTLFDAGSSIVNEREVIRLKTARDGRAGTLAAKIADKESVEAKINTLLPAQKESAIAALKEAEVSLSKMTVYASISGTVTQFGLQPGDYINPILRPAGILIPKGSGTELFQAGFGQMAAQVVHIGVIAEMTCISRPFKIIPMIITEIGRAHV